MSATEEIIINDVLVKHVVNNNDTTIIKSSIPVSQFIENISNNDEIILPNNCRFIKHLKNDKKILVIEEYPKVRTISYHRDFTSIIERHKINGKYDEYNLKELEIQNTMKFTLSFPFIVYVFAFNNYSTQYKLKVFFRLTPITGLDDYLLKPCLSNINNYFEVCLGDSRLNQKEFQNLSMNDKITECINDFWFNEFNTDYTDFLYEYEDTPEICDFFTWQHFTKINPHFIFSTKWKNANKTLNMVISDLEKEAYDYQETPVRNYLYFKNNVYRKIPDTKLKKYGTDSIILNDVILSCGDLIKFSGQEYYINGFDYNGNKTFLYLYSKGNRDFLDISLDTLNIEAFMEENQFHKMNLLDSIKINDNFELGTGSIITFPRTGQISKISKIFKLPDNTVSLRIGSDFFILNESFKKSIELLDENNFDVDGLKLVKGNQYYVFNTSRRNLFNHLSLFKGTYQGLDQKEFEKLKMVFSSNPPHKLKISYHQNSRDTNYRIFPADSSEIINEQIYRINNEIFYDTNLDKDILIIKHYGIGILDKNCILPELNADRIPRNNNDSMLFCKNYFKQICETFTFTIKSFDTDISYSLGDNVIIVNWVKPDEMLKIRKIIAFFMDDKYFYLRLSDDKNNILNFPIVKFDDRNNNVYNYFAMVRKVETKMENLEVGMKIRAKITGISDFPKKDVNEIKAFIIDDIHPMVLLSNYRTLYLNQLEDFEIYGPTRSRFYKMKISEPNLDISEQCGDIFIHIRKSDGNALLSARAEMPGEYISINTNGYLDYYYDFISPVRYGLLKPRLSGKQKRDLDTYDVSINEFGNILLKNYDCGPHLRLPKERIIL